MIRYCPHCWREIDLNAPVCSHCQRATEEDGKDFVSKLLSALRHPEPTRAGLAIDILTQRLHESRAVEPLLDLLTTARDYDILAQAARGLGLLGDSRAIPPLADLLTDPSKPLIARREAAFALGKLGGEEAARALSQALSDPSQAVAEAAWEAHDALKPK